MSAHIALICPTRQRPVQFKRMVESAFRTAHNPENIRVYFYTAEADPTNRYYASIDRCTHMTGPDWSTTMCANYLASHELMDDKDLLMMCADDVIFSTPHWDKALSDHYEALENKIHCYSLLDSRDKDGTPHPILTKEWVAALGYFSPPIFMHFYADTWLVYIAKANNCFTHLKDYLLIHEKAADQGKPDETHTRVRSLGWNCRDKFVADNCRDWLELQNHKLKSRIANNGKSIAEILAEKYLLDGEAA